MNKKGLTLIELLAVIVILAIITLIATPIILNIISNAQEGADIRSIEQYAKVLKKDYIEKKLINSSLTLENYIVKYATYATYDGDKIICVHQYVKDNDIVLEKCTVNGRGYYDYKNGKITKTDVVQENNTIPASVSFAIDSWSTIIENVKRGNLGTYNIGDEKEINLDGFGTYTVRIANILSPKECDTIGFSQTACGFVIEFVDIITNYSMNSENTSAGGWKDSMLRKYINETIYSSFPKILRENIINTNVVSGYGNNDITNFTTEDKLYLLSTKEVWGKEGISNTIEYDTAEIETRQLDYYKNKGVSTSNYSPAIKSYNGSYNNWWLRSSGKIYSNIFYAVNDFGMWSHVSSNSSNGVAVAFRIG